ncbi:hypothetical protein K469DRAFT_753553 [Zopfia rhizophila CBS 207.26]|uniref:Uncharacterized protein n=1 Tax=Zopfia rhizophila CBS 207.26 TaxID=1314779 RepID=A0A6A6DP97_9PEZI|nr:hypothetical protein K469DRAFT_753553 [Zopfia rhizophila CBS 207.26]
MCFAFASPPLCRHRDRNRRGTDRHRRTQQPPSQLQYDEPWDEAGWQRWRIQLFDNATASAVIMYLVTATKVANSRSQYKLSTLVRVWQARLGFRYIGRNDRYRNDHVAHTINSTLANGDTRKFMTLLEWLFSNDDSCGGYKSEHNGSTSFLIHKSAALRTICKTQLLHHGSRPNIQHHGHLAPEIEPEPRNRRVPASEASRKPPKLSTRAKRTGRIANLDITTVKPTNQEPFILGRIEEYDKYDKYPKQNTCRLKERTKIVSTAIHQSAHLYECFKYYKGAKKREEE